MSQWITLRKLLLASAAATMLWAGNANAAFILESVGGQSATHDTSTDRYWFPTLSFFGGGSFSFVEQQIASLNTTSYFGINNWGLATFDDMLTLQFSTEAELFGAFEPTHTTSATHLVGAGPLCFPSIGIFDDCVEVSVSTEHRFGIIDAPTQLTKEEPIPFAIPGFNCGTKTIAGFTFDLGPCTTTTQVDAHQAIDFFTSGGFTHVDITAAADNPAPGLERIWGAWVFGTFAGSSGPGEGSGEGPATGTIPEPTSLALLGIALVGLGFARKRQARGGKSGKSTSCLHATAS